VRHLKGHKIAQPLSFVLSLLVVYLTLWITTAGSAPAVAQLATHLPSWVVLDFSNDTSYGGSDIGREASDALVVELTKTNKFNLSARGDVATAMTNLGLTSPLNTVATQKLGRELNADAVVTGEVLSIVKHNNPTEFVATVAVRVTDVASGELVNGALARGSVHAPPGVPPDEDMLVGEAISQAAFTAVQRMSIYNLPIATIINNSDPQTVLLNHGTRDGLHPGLSMIVTRQGQEVGRIRVTTVEADDAEAVITNQGLGIQPDDKCKAIFALPAYSVHGNDVITTADIGTTSAEAASSRSAFSGVGGVLLAILAGALIVSFAGKGSNNGNVGGGAVGSASAATGFGPAVGLPLPAAGASPDLSIGNIISWGSGNLNPTSVQSFNIYRSSWTAQGGLQNGYPIPVLSVGRTTRSALDNGAVRTFTYQDVTDLSVVGGVPIGALNTATATAVPGILPGQSNYYNVSAVYSLVNASGTVGYIETPVTADQTGYATAIVPLDLQTQPTAILINGQPYNSKVTFPYSSITFSYLSVAGADTYVVDFSTSANFLPKVTLSPSPMVTTTAGGVLLTYSNINVLNLFPGSSGKPIYFRIGARNSIDSPGPVLDRRDYPNPDIVNGNSSYVYTTTGTFSGT
jgi:hypothetical protein